MKSTFTKLMLAGLVCSAPLAQAVTFAGLQSALSTKAGYVADAAKSGATAFVGGAKNATSALVNLVKRYKYVCGAALFAALATGLTYKAFQFRNCFANLNHDDSELYTIAELAKIAKAKGNCPAVENNVVIPQNDAVLMGMPFAGINDVANEVVSRYEEDANRALPFASLSPKKIAAEVKSVRQAPVVVAPVAPAAVAEEEVQAPRRRWFFCWGF